MYASRSAEWKETVTIISFFLFEMFASAFFFITWLIVLYLIRRWNSKTDSDHLVSGSNGLIPEERPQ